MTSGNQSTAVATPQMEWEPTAKWIRVTLGGQVIADTKRAFLLRENRRLPIYYIPQDDARMDLMTPTDRRTNSRSRGEATYWTITSNEATVENGAWAHPNPPEGAPDLKGYIAFEWDKMESWFEENEEVYVHARDPHKQIQVLESTRHVKVVLDGETIAESDHPVMIFEPNMVTRYYLPKLDVRMDRLVPSSTMTRCPYKGEASYYSVKVGDEEFKDIIWSYKYPTPEVAKIAGRLCFYNEKVDAIIVDGEEQPKP